jgi:hypothetical protein
MTRRQKDPLRPLSVEELQILEKLSRAEREPSVHVVRAQLLLAVAKGTSYSEAAQCSLTEVNQRLEICQNGVKSALLIIN